MAQGCEVGTHLILHMLLNLKLWGATFDRQATQNKHNLLITHSLNELIIMGFAALTTVAYVKKYSIAVIYLSLTIKKNHIFIRLNNVCFL